MISGGEPPRGKRLLGRLLTWGFMSLVLGGIAWVAWKQWPSVVDAWSELGIARIVASIILVMLAGAVAETSWIEVLPEGRKYRRSRLADAFFFSQLTRYLPGGVWPAAVLARILSRDGIPMRAAVRSFAVTSILGVIAGGLVGIVTAPSVIVPTLDWLDAHLIPGSEGGALHTVSRVAGVIAVLVFGAATLWLLRARNLDRVVNKVASRSGDDGEVVESETVPHKNLMESFAWRVVFWFLFGASMAVLAQAYGVDNLGDFMTMIGICVIASTAGILVFFAPSGIGIRDGLLILFLTPLIGPGPAIAVMAVSRLTTLTADLILAGCARMVVLIGKKVA